MHTTMRLYSVIQCFPGHAPDFDGKSMFLEGLRRSVFVLSNRKLKVSTLLLLLARSLKGLQVF